MVTKKLRMKKKYLYILFTFFLFSCSVKQKELSLGGALYNINLDGEKETSIPYSFIFKNVRTIILETNKDCLIGGINELQVFDGYIYILDVHRAKSLFVFDTEGRFIRKIGRLGRGPGEYIRVSDFTLDTENRFIFLQDQGSRVHKYQLDGTYVNSITVQTSRSNNSFIQYYNGWLYSSVLAWDPTPDDYTLLKSDPNDGKILSRSLPLKYNNGFAMGFSTGHSSFVSRTSNPPKYTQLFMNYIMSVGETIMPYIELKSENLVTDKDIENLQEEADVKKFADNLMIFLQESSKIWDVQGLVENDDLIIFRYQNGFYIFNTVVYNKASESVKLVNYLSNDLLFIEDKSGVFGRFVFSDTKGVYEVLHTNMFNDFQESIRRNEVVPDLDNADQLMQLNDDSNPVILFYEFK